MTWLYVSDFVTPESSKSEIESDTSSRIVFVDEVEELLLFDPGQPESATRL
ncbi:hypothetical protein [Halopelagius longus]|uniref:hypothetical protein n=1 Tax=Halopelagius longus TaxID=1236180 RepID=UPI001FDFB355|nr:hypothetical protein [Halopelagius longus]